MKKLLILVCVLALAMTAVFASGGNENGGTYPTKPVTCIIPYTPGGGSDILTRAVMKSIELPNGRPLISINTDGAGGYTGAVRAFHSPNDGYTILTHNPMDVLAYALSGQDSIPLWAELETIAMVVADYNIVTTNKTVATMYNWKSIEDVVAWCKANPDKKLKWGMVGAKTVNMVDSQRVAKALGIFDQVIFVPYDGGSLSRTAALANDIQLETCTASEIPAVVKSGDNIPLLVINGERIKSQPTIPTTVEKGIDITTAKWRGYYAPKGTDPAVLAILSESLKNVTENQEFVSNMENNLGFDVNYVDGKDAKVKIEAWFDELKPYFDEFNKQ